MTDTETDTTTSEPGIRVALVEDDDDVREALHDLLIEEGFIVDPYRDGAHALRELRNAPAPPDLILLDLNMRAMDGWQFRVEQKLDRRLLQIPVLAMSADGSAKARAIDADGFLQKPLDSERLVRTIREVLALAARRRLAQAQGAFERMASLGTLAAGIAHEINNPLAFITANLRLISEEIPRALTEIDIVSSGPRPANDGSSRTREQLRARLLEVATMVQESVEGATRIQNIVRDIRTFSHVDEAPRMPVVIKTSLDSAINLASSEIRTRARLVRDYGPVPKVMADDGKLGQVFLNLLVNAAQAMPEGEAANTITVATATDPLGNAVITIRDNGEGIRPDIRQRIFDPFFTTKGVGAGVGLGLSICHGIITSLGGEISVDSEVGRGSIFTVRLPPAPPQALAPPSPSPSRNSVSRGRILVIDDEPALARVLVRQLGKLHDVRAVTSGKDGLSLILNGEDFDVVLCDLLMPDVTGMDVYEQTAALRPGFETRLVFMTGGAFTPRAREFVAHVKNRFLDKPLDMRALTAALVELLG